MEEEEHWRPGASYQGPVKACCSNTGLWPRDQGNLDPFLEEGLWG